MFVLNLTRSQLESYRLIWGSFTNFDWTFLGPGRTFGFYGRLGVDVAGRIDLLGLCVACSGKMLVDVHGGCWSNSERSWVPDRESRLPIGLPTGMLSTFSPRMPEEPRQVTFC